MNIQSQVRKNSEVNHPAPEAEEQAERITRDYGSEKDTPVMDSGGGETAQIPAQEEDTLSEGDKMLLDYAHLTFLY